MAEKECLGFLDLVSSLCWVNDTFEDYILYIKIPLTMDTGLKRTMDLVPCCLIHCIRLTLYRVCICFLDKSLKKKNLISISLK